ncbi:MAG: hypothetical protein KF902_13030 [Phycisphaeraceae bacterium]|nr:hypothetical protein [Phycisphaeraceae bacterium]MCW5768148.1 hypothetical protein [Phycisphaeraceae bacterium]
MTLQGPARVDPAARASLDDRFAIASSASATERLNRPRHLVLFSLLVLVVAFFYLGSGIGDRASAVRGLKRQQRDAEKVIATANELAVLDARAAADPTSGFGAPMPDVLVRLERFATESGLAQGLSHRRGPGEVKGGATMYRYPYEIRDPNLENVMLWLQRCVSGIPGLEVQSLRIRPEAQSWYVSVTLSRWERSQ